MAPWLFAIILTMENTWSLLETDFQAENVKAHEGLFTLGSGYMHVRGSLEEHLDNALQNIDGEERFAGRVRWGTFVPGVIGMHPQWNREIINLPFFLGLEPSIDGERLNLEKCRFSDFRWVLNLRTAVLSRFFIWQTRSGANVRMFFERFVSAKRPHLCVQRLSVFSDRNAELHVRAAVDADVRTNGFDHFTGINFRQAGKNGIFCMVNTDGGDKVEIFSELSGNINDWTYRSDKRYACFSGTAKIKSGERFTMEKRSAVTTSRDLKLLNTRDIIKEARNKGFEELKSEHENVWEHMWKRSDVVIEGDAGSQLALRVSVFHLLRAHPADDSRVAIDAKGYAGTGYWGRFFWDTEIYMLPFFLYTCPEKAKTLLDFRINTLPGAQANARKYGFSGARYPWESDEQGGEGCPVEKFGTYQVHVTADVVFGMVHYARATGNMKYLTGQAAQVIAETCRYWLKRIDWKNPLKPVLRAVVGPDEYSPVVDSNSFTNRMVKFNLSTGLELGKKTGLTTDELDLIRCAVKNLEIVRSRENPGLVIQYEKVSELSDTKFFGDLSRDKIKQADVILLMMLFPDEFTDAEVRAAWDYYEPRTTHDSSLSAGVYGTVALRLGLIDQALKFWRKTVENDLNIAGHATDHGIHIAGAGIAWQMAVFGFAGLKSAMQSEKMTFNPNLPRQWSCLGFPLMWKNKEFYVNITHRGVSVENTGKKNCKIPLD